MNKHAKRTIVSRRARRYVARSQGPIRMAKLARTCPEHISG
jgi:hypothetical protein